MQTKIKRTMQTKIYKTKQFQKYQIWAKRPAKRIVDIIRPLTKKIDNIRDWEAIINDNIVPFLANPLTKQTGTYSEKKSLKEFVEERWKENDDTCLSKTKDKIGREYYLKMNFNINKRKKSERKVTFYIDCYCPYVNENGTHENRSFNFFGRTSFEVLNLSANNLWDAHFKASCEFNSIVNRNCLCEYPYTLRMGDDSCKYLHSCRHKKACNSKFCFAHLHSNAVDKP